MFRRILLTSAFLAMTLGCRTHGNAMAAGSMHSTQSVDQLLATQNGVDQLIAKLRQHPDAMKRVASAIAADPDRTREVVSQISANPKTSPELVRQCISLVNMKAVSPPTTVVPASAAR